MSILKHRKRKYSKLGLIGTSSARNPRARSIVVNPRTIGRYTQIGRMGVPRPPYSNPPDRTNADVTVNLAKASATHSTFAFSKILQDVVVAFPGSEQDVVTYPFTVFQGGKRVDLATAIATTSGQPFIVVPVAETDNTVFLTTAHATSATYTLLINSTNQINLAAATATTSAFPFSVSTIGIGQVTLTPADLLAIRDTILSWMIEGSTETKWQDLLPRLLNMTRQPAGGSSLATGVSAGGRGLFFEPQTIDKMLDEIRMLYQEKSSKTVTERIIYREPVIINNPIPVDMENAIADVHMINRELYDEDDESLGEVLAALLEEDE